MLVECFLAAVTHPDHVAELAMFDKLPSAARIVVGRFFSFFLAGGLDDAGQRKAAFAHAGMVCPSAPFAVNSRTHPLEPGKVEQRAMLACGMAPHPRKTCHTPRNSRCFAKSLVLQGF